MQESDYVKRVFQIAGYASGMSMSYETALTLARAVALAAEAKTKKVMLDRVCVNCRDKYEREHPFF